MKTTRREGGIRFRSVHFKTKTSEKATQAVSVKDGQSSLAEIHIVREKKGSDGPREARGSERKRKMREQRGRWKER